MTRQQWLKYLDIIDTYSKRGQLTHDQKVQVIDHLINKERKQWDQIEAQLITGTATTINNDKSRQTS